MYVVVCVYAHMDICIYVLRCHIHKGPCARALLQNTVARRASDLSVAPLPVRRLVGDLHELGHKRALLSVNRFTAEGIELPPIVREVRAKDELRAVEPTSSTVA